MRQLQVCSPPFLRIRCPLIPTPLAGETKSDATAQGTPLLLGIHASRRIPLHVILTLFMSRRPCSNCTKKGYPPEQCVDGCENCRRARVRCEEGKPCYRCRQLQLDCVEDLQQIGFTGQDAIPSSSSTRAPPPQRPNGSDRAKLACQNCRRDNKKVFFTSSVSNSSQIPILPSVHQCDDQRPCSRCIARSEECVHVARGPKLVKLRCEGCRQDNKRCEDARPCAHCLELGRECVSVPRKGRGHGTRVKAVGYLLAQVLNARVLKSDPQGMHELPVMCLMYAFAASSLTILEIDVTKYAVMEAGMCLPRFLRGQCWSRL